MPRPLRAPRRLRRREAATDLRAIVDECIVLADRLRWIAAQMHGDEGRRATRRGILRGLVRYGPQTVPQLARARGVTRQNVQPVIDGLVSDGLVEATPNTAHARSPLFCPTAAAFARVRAMDRNDARVLRAVGEGLEADQVARAAATLRVIRERFESTLRWRSALGPSRPPEDA